MATRKDVAERANVSVTVLSRVMSNRGYVSKEKREAVLRAAEELNYRPSPMARSLQKGQTRQILFYRGYLSNAYYLELHRGMMDYAEKQGYLACICGDLHIEKIGGLLMDGLILPIEAYTRPEYARYLKKYRMPCVIIGYGEHIPENTYAITVDTGQALRELVEYLRGKGHQRIAYVDGGNTRSVSIRNTTFRSIMTGVYHDKLENYLFTNPSTGQEVCPGTLYLLGRIAAEQFVQRKLDATAVICFNDDVAVGFYKRIVQLGCRIPEDISITSFDGLYIGEYLSPSLTSMALNPFEHGKKCAQVLLELLQGKRPGYKHQISYSLVERESVYKI